MNVVDRSMRGRVLVVDQHELMAKGLQLALSERCWDVETISSPCIDRVMAHVRRFEPQCVLLDIYLGAGVGSGIELIGPVRSTGAHVVIFTAERRRLVLAECIEAGAAGWIGRSATLDDVDSMLDDVVAGRSVLGCTARAALLAELRADRDAALLALCVFEQLSKREALVLSELINGFSAEEIASAHYVSLTTVRSQIRSVLQKLGVRSQLAAVALATPHKSLLPRPEGSVHERRRPHHPSAALADPAFRRSPLKSA